MLSPLAEPSDSDAMQRSRQAEYVGGQEWPSFCALLTLSRQLEGLYFLRTDKYFYPSKP